MLKKQKKAGRRKLSSMFKMMDITYYARFEKGDSGNKKVIVGIIPQLGVSNFGDTKESALEALTDSLKLYLETCKDVGNSIPKPKYIKNGEPVTIKLEDNLIPDII